MNRRIIILQIIVLSIFTTTPKNYGSKCPAAIEASPAATRGPGRNIDKINSTNAIRKNTFDTDSVIIFTPYNLVEAKRIELLRSACKADRLPLHQAPKWRMVRDSNSRSVSLTCFQDKRLTTRPTIPIYRNNPKFL